MILAAPTTCEVIVCNGESVSEAMEYVYSSDLTPVITSVSPREGGTGGGTEITITGTGFG